MHSGSIKPMDELMNRGWITSTGSIRTTKFSSKPSSSLDFVRLFLGKPDCFKVTHYETIYQYNTLLIFNPYIESSINWLPEELHAGGILYAHAIKAGCSLRVYVGGRFVPILAWNPIGIGLELYHYNISTLKERAITHEALYEIAAEERISRKKAVIIDLQAETLGIKTIIEKAEQKRRITFNFGRAINFSNDLLKIINDYREQIDTLEMSNYFDQKKKTTKAFLKCLDVLPNLNALYFSDSNNMSYYESYITLAKNKITTIYYSNISVYEKINKEIANIDHSISSFVEVTEAKVNFHNDTSLDNISCPYTLQLETCNFGEFEYNSSSPSTKNVRNLVIEEISDELSLKSLQSVLAATPMIERLFLHFDVGIKVDLREYIYFLPLSYLRFLVFKVRYFISSTLQNRMEIAEAEMHKTNILLASFIRPTLTSLVAEVAPQAFWFLSSLTKEKLSGLKNLHLRFLTYDKFINYLNDLEDDENIIEDIDNPFIKEGNRKDYFSLSRDLSVFLEKLPLTLESFSLDGYLHVDSLLPALLRFLQRHLLLKSFVLNMVLLSSEQKEAIYKVCPHASISYVSLDTSPKSFSESTSSENSLSPLFTRNHEPLVADFSLDADTDPAPSTYHLPILFVTNDPALNNPVFYRLRVYPHLNRETIEFSEEPQWETYEDYQFTENIEKEFKRLSPLHEKNLAWAHINLNPYRHNLLYSLSANEKIMYIEAPPGSEKDFYVLVSKAKSKQYAVVNLSKEKLNLKYLLKVDRVFYDEKKDQGFSLEEKKRIAFYQTAKKGKLNLEISDPTKKDIITAIQKHPVGVCRHLVSAYVHEYSSEKKEEQKTSIVAAVNSSAHAFAEVIKGDSVITVNVGRGERKEGEEDRVIFSSFSRSAPYALSANVPKKKRTKKEEEEYKRQMAYYERPAWKLNQTDPYLFLNDLFTKVGKKCLLILPTAAHTLALTNSAARYARQEKKPYFSIHDLDELQDPVMYSFLEQVKAHPEGGFLFARWDAKPLKPYQVGLNSIVEKTAHINEISLPENLQVVIMICQGSELPQDMYSRLAGNIIEISSHMPLDTLALEPGKIEESTLLEEYEEVNFSSDWMPNIVDQYAMTEGNFMMKAGRLTSALTTKKGLLAVNPPWGVQEFRIFWNKLIYERGYWRKHESETDKYFFQSLPDDFSLRWTTRPYPEWKNITASPLLPDTLPKKWKPLNPSTYDLFRKRIISDSEGNVREMGGYFSEEKDKYLPVILTGNIPDKSQWEEWVAYSVAENCTVHVFYTNEKDCPAKIPRKPPPVEEKEEKKSEVSLPTPLPEEKKATPFFSVIITSHPDLVVNRMTGVVPLKLGMDTTYNLVEEFTPEAKKDPISGKEKYILKIKEGKLLSLLKTGSRVVLMCENLPEFFSRIWTLLQDEPYLEYQGVKYLGKESRGKLTFVLTNNIFSFLCKRPEEIKFSPEAIEDAITAVVPKSEDRNFIAALCAHFSLQLSYPQQWQYILENLNLFPHRNPLQGIFLTQNIPDDKLKQLLLTQGRSYEKLRADHKRPLPALPVMDEVETRLQEIILHLKHRPFLFLMGPSSSGKSTFVYEKLMKHYETIEKASTSLVTVLPPNFTGIEEWLNQPNDGHLHFLFIDEANISSDNPSEDQSRYFFMENMEGGHGIIYQNKFFNLSPNHKVIFAGNYLSYEKRFLPNLFVKRDYMYHFPHFSSAYELKTLIPLLQAASLEEKEIERVIIVLEKERATLGNQKITWRNMTAMISSFYYLWKNETIQAIHRERSKEERLELFAKWVFFQHARDIQGNNPLVLRCQLFGTLTSYCHLKKQFLPRVRREKIGNFSLVSHFKRAVAVLQEEMGIRDLLFHDEKFSALFSGNRGLLLEGKVGGGKSRLVINWLEKAGFKNADMRMSEEKKIESKEELKEDKREKRELGNRYYYHVPLTCSDENIIRKKLMQALYEGAVVVIDELNSFPSEHILNSLLMGRDDKGKLVAKKGFYVIATQNPINVGQREPLSIALENRFRKLVIADPSQKDIEKIIVMEVGEDKLPKEVIQYFSMKFISPQKGLFPTDMRMLLEKNIPYAIAQEAKRRALKLAPPSLIIPGSPPLGFARGTTTSLRSSSSSSSSQHGHDFGRNSC